MHGSVVWKVCDDHLKAACNYRSNGGVAAEQAAREEARMEESRRSLAAFEAMVDLQKEGFRKVGPQARQHVVLLLPHALA